MFVDLILLHIPRSWKAAVALLVLVVSATIGLAGLTKILIGGAGASDWLKCILGLIITTASSIIFYGEQSAVRQPKTVEQIQVEILNQAGHDLAAQAKPSDKPKLTGWNMNDDPIPPSNDKKLN